MKALYALAMAAAVLAAVQIYLRKVWFYRDPVRVTPEAPDLVFSPADGKVVYIRPFRNGRVHAEKLGEAIPIEEIHKARVDWGDEGWIMGIYMSPLDVHFNYAPVAGRVEGVVHTPAQANLPMVDLWEYVRLTYLRRAVDLFARKYHLNNERNTIFIRDGDLKLAVVEIADKFVNKISCYVRPGDALRAGQKLSFIARGSQVDLIFFAPDVEFLVRVGDQVYGALTPVARLPRNAPAGSQGANAAGAQGAAAGTGGGR